MMILEDRFVRIVFLENMEMNAEKYAQTLAKQKNARSLDIAMTVLEILLEKIVIPVNRVFMELIVTRIVPLSVPVLPVIEKRERASMDVEIIIQAINVVFIAGIVYFVKTTPPVANVSQDTSEKAVIKLVVIFVLTIFVT